MRVMMLLLLLLLVLVWGWLGGCVEGLARLGVVAVGGGLLG
jgi:hypothetical protein